MSLHGHDSYIQIGKETTYGTKPATVNEWVGIVQSFSPEEGNNLARQFGLGSRNFIQSKIGSKTFGGSFEFLVQNFKMLEYALGSVTYGTTPTGEIYTHTISESNDLPSFTVQAGVIGTPNFVRDFTGCKVNTLTLTAEKEEALTCEVEFIAQSSVDSSSGTPPVADTSSYFSFYEGSVTINGVQQDIVEEFELEISNGLEGLFALGSMEIVRLQEGQREYTLSIGQIFESNAQYLLWKNGTEFDAVLSFVAPDGRELHITCHNCKYDTNELEHGAEDYMVQSLEAFPKSVSIEVKTASPTSL
jgi:hypothetical protein